MPWFIVEKDQGIHYRKINEDKKKNKFWDFFHIPKIGEKIRSVLVREWVSGKLVEYESLRVSNGRVESGRVGSKMVKLQVDMRVYTEKFQFFNVKYHAIIEIVE